MLEKSFTFGFIITLLIFSLFQYCAFKRFINLSALVTDGKEFLFRSRPLPHHPLLLTVSLE